MSKEKRKEQIQDEGIEGELKQSLIKIEQLEKRVRELEQKLTKDELTELSTRGHFKEIIANYIKSIRGEKEHSERREHRFGYDTISIVFLDIDNFKNINDTYGHNFGDDILRDVARVLKANTRDLDVVARWGGEEIVIALLGANESQAVKKAGKIREAVKNISKKYVKDHPDLKITASIGVKEYDEGAEVEDLVKMADEMMYLAKETGKDRVVPYSQREKVMAEITRAQ